VGDAVGHHVDDFLHGLYTLIPFILLMQKVILASSSPRRSQLLEWAEIPFEVIVKHSAEDYPPSLQVEDVPEYLAREKATLVWNSLHQEGDTKYLYEGTLPVLAADTEVIMDNIVFGKPANREEAIFFLKKLSGKTHKVVSGVAILFKGNMYSFSETTLVTFHQLDEQEIARYVDKYGPFDKAGGYAIQEWIGVCGIKRIEGDFYNVMGLPISRVNQKLKELWENVV
jgi:septum formation protein